MGGFLASEDVWRPPKHDGSGPRSHGAAERCGSLGVSLSCSSPFNSPKSGNQGG